MEFERKGLSGRSVAGEGFAAWPCADVGGAVVGTAAARRGGRDGWEEDCVRREETESGSKSGSPDLCVCVCVRACVCVCVCERERERETERVCVVYTHEC